MAIYSTAL